MNIEFTYIHELESFIQILALGFVLSLPVCFLVETLKATGITEEKFYFAASIIISALFGTGFAVTFTQMSMSEALWLCVCLWMGSQGFYEYLKDSDSVLGKMFVSLADRTGGENVEKIQEETREDDEEFMMFPVNYVGITTAFSAFHPAIDFGYSNSYGGKYQPVIAPCDMKVVCVGENNSIGRYIRAFATLNGVDYTFRFIHMSATSVKTGQSVKKGAQIGKMGNTGTTSNGYHLHFDIWKGHVEDMSSSADRFSYSVDPLSLCHLTQEQTVGDVTDKRYEIKRAGE